MQKFMMLRPDKDLDRAWAWMDTQLAEVLNGDADEETVVNTLSVIHEYSRITKVSFLNLLCHLAQILNMLAGHIPFLSCHCQTCRTELASST